MKKRQALWVLTPPLLILISVIMVWTFWAHDKLASYALSQIPTLNSMQDKVEIKVQDIDFSLLKLQVKATDIDLVFKKEFKYLNTAHIDNIKLQVDPFNLMIGLVSASYVRVESLRWEWPESAYRKIFLSPTGPTPEINLEPVFKMLPEIPIQNVYLANSWLKISVPPTPDHAIEEIKLNIVSLQVANQKKSIEMTGSEVNLNLLSNQKAAADINANLYAKVDLNSIKKLNFEITKNNSSIRGEMSSNHLKSLLIDPQIEGQIKGDLLLSDLRSMAYIVKNTTSRIPQVTGSVHFSGAIKTRGFNRNEGKISLNYDSMSIDALKFGSGEFSSLIKNNSFDINSVKLEHPSGVAQLKNISFENTPPYKFKTDIVVNEFSLQKLFLSINEKNIPAFLNLQGTATCEGQVENFNADCKADLQVENVEVYADMKKSLDIVTLKKAQTTATAQINLNELNFKNTVQLKSSAFQAEGKVIFKEGFNFNFKTDGLNLDDVENIAELKLKGVVKGTLNAFGNTDYGVIDAQLQVDQAGIDDFVLGDISTLLTYKAGLISLSSMQGQMGSTLYSGAMVVDVDKKQTRGDFRFSQLKVTDALAMIEPKWHLPIQATGQGQASVSFNGPLNFWKLKTKINANLVKGSLYDESFTRLDAHIESDGQQMNFKNVRMTKTVGHIDVSDYIDTREEPQLNLKIASKNLKADDIDHLNLFFKNFSGDIQINGKIIGSLDDPRIITQNQINQFQIENFKLPNSQMDSELNKRYFHANGQVFGRQIQADLKIPLADTENFSLKAKLSDFQTLLLLPLIDIPIPEFDIKSHVTGNVELTAPPNSNNQLNGKILIDQFSLERGSQTFKLAQPSEIIYKGHVSTMTPVVLTGPDQNLTISLKNQKVHASGRLFLKPLQFLAPFAENMSGIIEFSTNIQFKNGRPEFSGEGLINDASFSTKGFPYPINNISAFFDLYDSKIDFTEISAMINQTRLFGDGLVDIKGSKNVKLDFNLESEELELEFPSKIFTGGLAKIKFFGDWLPYTLKIDYDITQGLVTKEFSSSEDDTAMVLQPNSLLPASQLDSSAQSLLLDISTQFGKGIVIKNSLVEGVVTGFLNLTGNPNSLVSTGMINVQPGSKLIFKDKPFEIQSGLIKFNGTKDFNPDVAVVANARVTDYDISLNISGPAKKLDIKATSQPALSDNDIFSLLALGYTSSSTDQNLTSQSLSSDAQQTQTGLEVLSVIGNQSEFTKKIQSRLGVNVQLAPSVDSTRNIAVPKVIVSKQLSKKVNTSYSRSLTGDRQNNEVKLQWLFRPDTSLILNYQNQPNIQENNIITNQENEIGVGGFDLEFKKEFQ